VSTVQTVGLVMNGIVTHESYDSVLVGTGKQKGCLKTASDRRRCDVERHVVPDRGTRNRKRPPADCREMNRQNVQTSEVEDCRHPLDVVSATRVKHDYR